MALSPELLAGIRAFNRGDYFDAHEHWEDHWGHGPQAERDLVYGLIKVAVALHHLEGGNVAGFDAQLGMGIPHLRAHKDELAELDLHDFVEDVESLKAAVRFHGDGAKVLAKGRPLIPEPL